VHDRAIKLKAILIALVAAGVLIVAPSVAHAQFGIASFTTTATTAQAGAHPDLSLEFRLDTEALGNPAGQIANASIGLPPGVVGNPQAVERCSTEAFERLTCSPASQIGVLDASSAFCRGVGTPLEVRAKVGATRLSVENTSGLGRCEVNRTITIGTGASAETDHIASLPTATAVRLTTPLQKAHVAGEPVTHIAELVSVPIPLFNLQPSPGRVATFGARQLGGSPILAQVGLRADGQLTVALSGLATPPPIVAASVTLWGVPADPSHEAQRCTRPGHPCDPSTETPVPFMTNPSDCTRAPLESTLHVESEQGQSAANAATLAPPTGCEQLEMSPSIAVATDTTQRDTPAGYEIDLKVPQEEAPDGIATPDLRDVSLTFPSGTSLSPAMTNGLVACTDAQFGEGLAEGCPDASKVGTAEVTSPLLAGGLTGALYVAAPTPTEKYRIFLKVGAADAAIDLVGRVELNEQTGQVTAVFENLPQVPLSGLRLVFFGGTTAVLANPAVCGPATTTAQITSYGGLSASPSSTFTIDSGPGGEGCPPSLPFAPGFSAGTSPRVAAGFSPFTLTVSRADGQQELSSLGALLPPGLLAMLSQVALCRESEASAGGCPPTSQVGSTMIGAGAGAQPLYLAGAVYLTGPYEGAPFGLSIVVPATAGPFNLGTIVIRARILVNPSDMQMTIASDPLPRIIGGIPLRLRTVNLTIGRPDFVFDPSNCAPQTITATVDAVEGASAVVSTPFQVIGCSGLSFAPGLTSSTQADGSSVGDGASLNVRITDPVGAQANIRSVTVQLPGRLRPRLSTIQHACPSATFLADPGSCPEGAAVGSASVNTPVLSSPLTGPIYLVAGGGGKSPKLMMPLEGDGIKVRLAGVISVSKRNVVSAAFRGLPDVPISRWDLAFSRGPHSMLGAIGALCSGRLVMPYTIVGENAAQIRRSSRVTVEGCAKRMGVEKARGRVGSHDRR
jgi:hypothetical protein